MKFSATAFQAFNTTRGNNEVALSNHFTMSYELTTNSKTERDVVVGTMLNRLFRYLSLQKQTGARFANLSHPVLLKFNVGKTTIDMRDIEERLQATFKVGQAYLRSPHPCCGGVPARATCRGVCRGPACRP